MGNTYSQGGVAAATTDMSRNSWRKDTSPRVIIERLTPRAFSATADDITPAMEILQRHVQQKIQGGIITIIRGKQRMLSQDFVEKYASSDTQSAQDILEDVQQNDVWLLGVNGVYFPIDITRGPSVTHWTASVTIRL